MAERRTATEAAIISRSLTPLGIIGLFLALAETVAGIVATQVTGVTQERLGLFVISFPVFVALCFFLVLWSRPKNFYAPLDYREGQDPRDFAQALDRSSDGKPVTKTADLGNKILEGTVKVVGNPDHFELLFKAAAPAWVKSTKAMKVDGGCIVQVSTELLGEHGRAVAEALTFVPGVSIEAEGSGKRLVAAGK